MTVRVPTAAATRRCLYWIAGLVLAAGTVLTLQAQQPAAQPASTQPAAQAAKPAATTAPNGTTSSTASANSGQAANQAADTGPILHLGANEVNLIFTVTDKHGNYIPNLKLSDFALLDDQRAPERVTSFRQQTNLPLRVGILVDTSSSIRSRFSFEQQSAIEFLLEMLRARYDKAFVMGFDVEPDVTADWTNNLDALETGVDRLHPGGGTALYDAVYTACRDKLLTQRGPEPVRKAMILISDGEDDQSHAYEDEAIKMCQRSETIIYAISTNWTPSRGRGDKVLTQMADATGGQVFFPDSAEDMSTSFKSIETELRSQYLLTYTPADFKYNGEFRSIYLYCNDRRYQVRAKKGYFAPTSQ